MARRDVVQILRQEVGGPSGRSFFAAPSAATPIALCSAPGRLDVLGGLGVQVGGTVAQMALPLRIALAVQPDSRPQLTIRAQRFAAAEETLDVPLTDEPCAEIFTGDRITGPLAAMWHVLRQSGSQPLPAGARIMLKSDIPRSAGQASSIALLTAMAAALLSLQNHERRYRTAFEPAQVAALIQQAAELCSIANPGAAIDATTCLLAGQPHFPGAGAPPRPALLRYSAQTSELVGQVQLPENVRILALDTGVRHPPPLAQALQELRVAGAMGLKIIETVYRDLGQARTPLHGYLANTSPLLYRQYFRALLPRRLRGSDFTRTYGPLPSGIPFDAGGMYRVRTAVDHLIAENEHAEQFLQAMEELSERDPSGALAITDPEERQRTLQRAGRLALASHHSYRLRLELSCREADWLVDHLMEAGPERGIYGARITGAGGGGTVMALTDQSASAGDAILEIIEAYPRVTGRALGVVEAGTPASAGALWASLETLSE